MRAAELFTNADSRGLRRHGLSTAARILLATLEGADEPLSQTAIAERLFVTGASVSSLVDTLERTGLVRRIRSASDRRVVLVGLTDAAYPVIDAYLADVTTLHAHEFAVLDENERETFVRLLAKSPHRSRHWTWTRSSPARAHGSDPVGPGSRHPLGGSVLRMDARCTDPGRRAHRRAQRGKHRKRSDVGSVYRPG